VTDLPVLDAVEQRILGCLLEKQATVPATYPLTLNSLRTACNQTSSREPVMDLDEHAVETVARALRDRGLIRIVWADTGRRVLKYHQTLDETVVVTDAERALLTVLLLRGAQTPGELKTRTERLHPFPDKEDVEAVLQRLAARDSPVVHRLERRPGQQDHRWAHLLGPAQEHGTAAADTRAAGDARLPSDAGADRERPLAQGAAARDDRVRATYAAVAERYADTLATELDDLPFERWLLGRVVEHADGRPVVDAGCGPGHVTAYLAAAGADACGVDLTAEMVEQARERFPGVRYDVGDLTRLLRPDHADGWGAVLAWYSLIHLAGSELPGAVAALARPLAPGGLVVVAVHAGHEVRHLSSWFERDVDLDAVLHDPADVVAAMTATGLETIEWYRRGPIRSREETTDRLYVLARRPAA
jgi:hypothetical protein